MRMLRRPYTVRAGVKLRYSLKPTPWYFAPWFLLTDITLGVFYVRISD